MESSASTDNWDVEETRDRIRRYSTDGHKTAEYRYGCCKRVVIGYESDTMSKCLTQVRSTRFHLKSDEK